MAKKKKSDGDTYSYKGWLVSDHFLKRAFAVYGHSLVAGLIMAALIYGTVIIVMLVIFAIAGAAGYSV